MLLLQVNQPDAFVMISNISEALEYFFSWLRYFIIVVAFVWAFYALANVYAVSTGTPGQPNKFFPTKSQPTLFGAWMQLVIAGLALLTALTLLPLASSMSFITGTSEITAYSIGSYDKNQTDLTVAISALVHRGFAFIGLLAWFRGFVTWQRIAEGASDQRMGRVFGFFFFGLCCFAIDWINAFLSNIIGFDIFKSLLGAA